MPHTGKRAATLAWRSAASSVVPPTLSKYTSMPCGQWVRSASSSGVAL
jgi:hypothetical protein